MAANAPAAQQVESEAWLLAAVTAVGVELLHHESFARPAAAAGQKETDSVALSDAAPAGFAGVALAHIIL